MATCLSALHLCRYSSSLSDYMHMDYPRCYPTSFPPCLSAPADDNRCCPCFRADCCTPRQVCYSYRPTSVHKWARPALSGLRIYPSCPPSQVGTSKSTAAFCLRQRCRILSRKSSLYIPPKKIPQSSFPTRYCILILLKF